MTARKRNQPAKQTREKRTETSSVSLPVELWAEIKAMAVDRKRSASFIIREWIEQGIAK